MPSLTISASLIRRQVRVEQALADEQACSVSLVGIPTAMLYGGTNLYNGWDSAIKQWLSSGSSYDYGSPGRNGGETLSWSQVRMTPGPRIV